MGEFAETPDVARLVVTAALGRDPGPMVNAPSDSHHVYIGADVVVKIIDSERHSRLARETALAPFLPVGLLPPLLASGLYPLDSCDIRFACYERAPGKALGMGMPDLDPVTARLLAEQAVARLGELHRWSPATRAEKVLSEPLDHGGFVSREALIAEVEKLAELNQDERVPRALLAGLMKIAEHAPRHAHADVPVHADCHWANWLSLGQSVTALLDFEWARFGEPLDDWFFLARFSGPHVGAVLDVISGLTSTSPEHLRAGCEVREAAHLASDLLFVLEHPGIRARMAAKRLEALEQLVVGHYWWSSTT